MSKIYSFTPQRAWRFAAIDLQTESAWVADTAEQVLELAARQNPEGCFYLIELAD